MPQIVELETILTVTERRISSIRLNQPGAKMYYLSRTQVQFPGKSVLKRAKFAIFFDFQGITLSIATIFWEVNSKKPYPVLAVHN